MFALLMCQKYNVSKIMRPILVKKDDVCPGIWVWWELGKVNTLVEI